MVAVLEGFSLIAAVMAVGWLLAHTGLFGREEQRMLARLTFWVGSPALLFLIVSRTAVEVIFSGFLVATVVAVAVCATAYLLLARLLLRRRWADAIMGGMAASYVNTNNLGIPIAIYVLGDASWAAPVLLMQLLCLQPAWLAALDATRVGRVSWRRVLRSPFTNPLTLGTVAGLAVNLSGWRPPSLLLAPVELVSGIAVPCMLIAFGLSLRLAPLPGREALAEPLTVLLVKMVLMPVVAGVVAGPVLHLDTTAVLAVVVMAALPTAQNVYVLSLAYGHGERIARDAVFLTTVLSLPVMLLVMALLGD
ncbi:AEC family transporter [Serinicoccus kebangsaanensis]|uniref:AEC family transporter n=1 Tax=Serinicoccus kebangsaanensis TaxID=2602069 RepID=UPI00124E37C8|nr:AEC family transporter [Serinicoccus kebangsaanensis]